MRDRLWRIIGLPARFNGYGSLAIVLVVAVVMTAQILDRSNFADSELRDDVMNRWGAPIHQAAPSVRYVETGSVFNTLEPLALESQRIRVDAAMSYRKRGLAYFSGFEFEFEGRFTVRNPEPHAIDIVFVFPVQLARKSMLSDLRFEVNGREAPLPLSQSADELTWTGRLAEGEGASFDISFRGRGLDEFTYLLDPELPVRDLVLEIGIVGGENYDYAHGVIPATHVEAGEDGRLRMRWAYASLESGFPLGVILPSEEAFDAVLGTMIRRMWVTFVLFFGAVAALSVHVRRPLVSHESYLVAATYAFFFVLLPYLAAFMHFYLAYVLSSAVIGGLLVFFLTRTLSPAVGIPVFGLVVGLLYVPTLAVVLQGYTGLIYSLEILTALIVLMVLSTRPGFRRILEEMGAGSFTTEGPRPQEPSHG